MLRKKGKYAIITILYNKALRAIDRRRTEISHRIVDVPKSSSNMSGDPENVPYSSPNVHVDSEDVPKSSFNVIGDSDIAERHLTVRR
ncbi:unnamed protein product [Heligmosomoides polygyrus]|uniref:Ovule protein n=1 Tax=Heligmosomoides polygyrus TaxID=6339 RepID=A0A183G435_HELPZ|nr:unnamed protein product [Heligmosomoides polygyrus]